MGRTTKDMREDHEDIVSDEEEEKGVEEETNSDYPMIKLTNEEKTCKTRGKCNFS